MARSGQLTGTALRGELAPLAAVPQRGNLDYVSAANAVLLHDMVHCPSPEDRQAAGEIAARFEENVGVARGLFGSVAHGIGEMPIDRDPIPFSPLRWVGGAREAHWMTRLVPELDIHWEKTHGFLEKVLQRQSALWLFLGLLHDNGILTRAPQSYFLQEGFVQIKDDLGILKRRHNLAEVSDLAALAAILMSRRVSEQKIYAIPFVLEGKVPSYARMHITDGSVLQPEEAFDLLRLAMVTRGRGAHGVYRGEQINMLSIEGIPRLDRLVSQRGNEALFTFGFEGADRIQVVGLKHGWPFAYGAIGLIRQDFRAMGLGRRQAVLDFTVLPEFRGTESSGQIFQLLLRAAREQVRLDCFLVRRDLTGGGPLAGEGVIENQEAITAFYLRNGFQWMPGTIEFMFR
jgi:hypothetical protein